MYFQGQFIHYPAKPVSVVDTTGAGDAFVAGLLAGLADSGIPTNTRQLERIIAQAQICGALATTAKGAMTALPRQHDLLHNSDPAVVSVTRFVVPVTFTKSV